MARRQGGVKIVRRLASVVSRPKKSLACSSAAQLEREKDDLPTAAFPSNQGFTKEEKENADVLELSS